MNCNLFDNELTKIKIDALKNKVSRSKYTKNTYSVNSPKVNAEELLKGYTSFTQSIQTELGDVQMNTPSLNTLFGFDFAEMERDLCRAQECSSNNNLRERIETTKIPLGTNTSRLRRSIIYKQTSNINEIIDDRVCINSRNHDNQLKTMREKLWQRMQDKLMYTTSTTVKQSLRVNHNTVNSTTTAGNTSNTMVVYESTSPSTNSTDGAGNLVCMKYNNVIKNYSSVLSPLLVNQVSSITFPFFQNLLNAVTLADRLHSSFPTTRIEAIPKESITDMKQFNNSIQTTISQLSYQFEKCQSSTPACDSFDSIAKNDKSSKLYVVSTSRKGLESYYQRYMQDLIGSSSRSIHEDPKISLVSRYIDSIPGGDASNLWQRLYYSFKCGAYNTSVTVFDMYVAEGMVLYRGYDDITNTVRNFLENFCTIMGDGGNHNDLLDSQKLALKTFYDNANCPYARAVLQLICNRINEPSAIDAKNIDDYFWNRFTHIYHLAQSDLNFAFSQFEKVKTELIALGESHFNPDGNSPQIYLQVLLMLQEYEGAVEYFLNSGYIVEATHIALALYHYGVLRVYNGKSNNKDYKRQGKLLYQHASSQFYFLDIYSLIWDYVKDSGTIDQNNIQIAVDYICCIRDRSSRLMYLGELLKNLNEANVLALLGSSNLSNGSTSKQLGYLSKRLSLDEVNELASYTLRSASKRGEESVVFDLTLNTGQHVMALNLILKQLSAAILPVGLNILAVDSKGYPISTALNKWADKGGLFFQKHIVSKENVDASIKPLGRVLQLLLNLETFFCYVGNQDYYEAIICLMKSKILPNDTYEVKDRHTFMKQLIEGCGDQITLQKMLWEIMYTTYVLGLKCLYYSDISSSQAQQQGYALCMLISGCLSGKEATHRDHCRRFDEWSIPFRR